MAAGALERRELGAWEEAEKTRATPTVEEYFMREVLQPAHIPRLAIRSISCRTSTFGRFDQVK